MEQSLKGQRAIIMGGTSGMGLASARLLVEMGADVVVTGRDQAKLETALQHLGQGAKGEQLNAASYDDLKSFYERQGSFDHLVIAVSGAKGGGNFRELSLDELRKGFDAKFWPQVMSAQLSLNTLSGSGSITFLTSISARSYAPGNAGLTAINAALESMVPILAQELAPVRVNAISPGVVDTPWWNWLPEDQKNAAHDFYKEKSPVNRIGQPEDIAKAVRYLIDNTFVTGTVLEVDGGLRLR
ncbi:NAD(P)-dependent dehydrogenase (short-subunit alcohol dehydrogenase family) [Paenibacillus favisporus]|uniref:NAD(P)-dependent dehydrogenase (Short-subunit alcohol dehydrogenase family) n=1 Tax=Paenibacillus favisporus TaxID=221028 RepID=A0ABV2F1P0_9BACL